MNKIEKLVIGISSLLMGLVLSRFAISKLTGWDISVKAFIEMAKPLGINPSLFRISTGVVILVVFLAYLGTSLYTFFQNNEAFKNQVSYYKLSLFANGLGLITMIGALFAEFLLRVEPKWMLVYIAVGVIVFSAINISIILKKAKPLTLTSNV